MKQTITPEIDAVRQLDDMIKKEEDPKKTNAGRYTLLALVFPPFTTALAIFFSWRKKSLYVVLPTILIFYSITCLLAGVTKFISIRPPTGMVESGIATVTPTYSASYYVASWTAIIVSIFGIVGGFYFRSRARWYTDLDKRLMWTIGLLLILQTYLIFYIVTVTFSTLYSDVAKSYGTQLGY